MILVDTSVWIDYFKGTGTPQTEKLDNLLGREPLAIGDLILTEVLQGFTKERDFNEARNMLTSLSVVELGGQPGIIGSLVQSNFGGRLAIDGVSMHDLQSRAGHDALGASLMMIVATDLPLSNRLLNRVAKRAVLGMARAGSSGGHGSGGHSGGGHSSGGSHGAAGSRGGPSRGGGATVSRSGAQPRSSSGARGGVTVRGGGGGPRGETRCRNAFHRRCQPPKLGEEVIGHRQQLRAFG